MVGKASRLIVAFGLAALAAAAHAQTYSVRGACRDGFAHGVYELRDADGKLRTQGAFNRGARTSSFIYWTSAGVRVAHVPYDDGVVSGTVALWYSQTLPTRESRQKLEAAYTKGQRNGLSRAWFPNGRPRGEYVYENGKLVSAKAWNSFGVALADKAASEQATRDAEEDTKYFASLDAIVEANLPTCEPAANGDGTKS